MTDFEALYETHFNYVYLYIRKLSHSEAIAEEITSETFFRALSSINSFRGECDVKVWLCQIAKNSYFSYIKEHELTSQIEGIEKLDQIPYGESLEELIIAKEEVSVAQFALHNLRDPYKEVFMWRLFGELSFKQIGRLFNKTENWACVTYHRARKMIQKNMEVSENEK